MEKVFISKVLKGKEPAKSIGMIDTVANKLYVPFISKKGICIIDSIDIDYIEDIENGYKIKEIGYTKEGNPFINVYYVTKIKESEVK